MSKKCESDLKMLQAMCHSMGREVFLKAIVEVLYRASDDTGGFEDKSLSENYRIAATGIQNLLDDGSI